MTGDSQLLPSWTVRYPRRQGIRAVLRAGIAAGFALLADFDIIGKENMPQAGPLLIVGNHFSFLDPVALIHATSYPLEFMGGIRAPNAPPWADIFRRLWGVLMAQRGGSSRDALLGAESVLNQGGVLAIFPEGGSWATVLRPARPGAALLAARTPAKVLPVGFDGLLDVFSKARRGRRGKITIRYGEPFGPLTLDRKDAAFRQRMDEIGHEMMRRIAQLIPPERRGFYSDDPAIREKARGAEVYPWAHNAEV
jgi:1-acyl-sn-glycerol-3-phosphate acyltransferase